MNTNAIITVCFQSGSLFAHHTEPVDGPVIEFMVAESFAEGTSKLITIPVMEDEFEYLRQKAADEGLTVEQWLIAGIRRAIADPEILRAPTCMTGFPVWRQPPVGVELI